MYEITGKTKLTALLGSPVSHSISPQMHNEAFRLLNLDYTYLAFDVTPQNLNTAIQGLKAIDIKGFNVTMPLKTSVLEFVDELTPAALLAQSVNTVINKDGTLIGHTTDGIGYMDSLKDSGIHIIGKEMTILGAGGAATAICVQAALDGVSKIHIFKRKNSTWNSTYAFAEKITKETNCIVSLHDVEDETELKSCILRSDILTNATNVGMAPNLDHSLVTQDMLYPSLVVSDIIYNPFVTKLLHQAKEVGCKYINGLYMLLFQGAASFQCWTGQPMPITPIKEKYFTPKGE